MILSIIHTADDIEDAERKIKAHEKRRLLSPLELKKTQVATTLLL